MGEKLVAALAVFMGGGIGSVLRYVLTLNAERAWGLAFPWGTLGVNVLGSFGIGLAWALSGRLEVSSELRLFVLAGVFGGFTTFSAFSLETLNLLREGAWRAGLLNVAVTNVACLAAVTAGYFMARALWR